MIKLYRSNVVAKSFTSLVAHGAGAYSPVSVVLSGWEYLTPSGWDTNPSNVVGIGKKYTFLFNSYTRPKAKVQCVWAFKHGSNYSWEGLLLVNDVWTTNPQQAISASEATGSIKYKYYSLVRHRWLASLAAIWLTVTHPKGFLLLINFKIVVFV